MKEFNENEKSVEIKTGEETGEGFLVNENTEIEQKPETMKKTLSKELFEWIEVIVTAVIAVVTIFVLVFRVATIDGPSMMNTLYNGDKVIITNFSYTPKMGDVVVISRNIKNSIYDIDNTRMPIIKRIIATEGQKVDIDFEQGIVYVDDKKLNEPYILEPTTRKFDVEFPVTVPPGSVFVLGDNRNNSMDSRDSTVGNDGMIDERYILGRAVFRIFPFEKMGGIG